MRTLFGCAGMRGPLDGYSRRFDAIELDILDREPATRTSTLRRWRSEAGPRLTFSLVAPAAVVRVRPTAELDAGLERLLEAQRLVQARFLLLATPIDVTPAPLPRERLARVVERIRAGLGDAREVVRIAWEPRGVWELESAAVFARSMGVDLCADPLIDPREPFWDSSLRYVRVATVGGRTEIPASRLRALAELLVAAASDDDAAARAGDRLVVLTSPHAATEVKRLRALVKTAREVGVTGGSRVIRPRAAATEEE